MSQPLLSMVLSNYQGAAGVETILEETPLDVRGVVEYVVVDDASPPDERARLASTVSRYAGACLIQHERNSGVVKTLMDGFAVAQGEYVCFRGSDDRSLGPFWEVVRTILPRRESGIICGDIYKRRAQRADRFVESSGWCAKGAQLTMTAESFIEQVGERQIWGQSVFIRRQIFTEFGGFAESLAWASDLITFMSAAFKYGLHYIAEPLVEVEVDRRSFSAKGAGVSAGRNAVLETIIKVLSESPTEIVAAYARSGWLGRFGSALAAAYLAAPQLWSATATTLIERSFYYLNRERDAQRLIGGQGQCIRLGLRTLKKKVDADPGISVPRIAIYGAGVLGLCVLREWPGSGLPEISSFVTSDAVAPFQTFHGFPLRSVDELSRGAADYVVIASKAFQQEMQETCLSCLDASRIIAIFDPTTHASVSPALRVDR